jgi:hypothetical protein
VLGGSDISSLTRLSPAVKPGNFGLSGNGLLGTDLWGLGGSYYTGKTINQAFLNDAANGAVPFSILSAMGTNAIDYTWGPHANETVFSQGYGTSTTVDSTTNILGSGSGLAVGATLMLYGSVPEVAIPAALVVSFAVSNSSSIYLGGTMKTNLNNLIDVIQGEKTCDGIMPGLCFNTQEIAPSPKYYEP